MKQTRFLHPSISLALRLYSPMSISSSRKFAAIAPKPQTSASSTDTEMGRDYTHLGGPAELQDALGDHLSLSSEMPLPACGVFKLFCVAEDGHGDYTWGYKIYRTTYQAGTDAKFARAIEVLNKWMRDECLNNMNERREQLPSDSKAKEQLAQRLRNEIVEDRELLEGASTETLLTLHQEWVHLERKAIAADSPHYRFFLVIDDDVLNHLLNLSEKPGKWSCGVDAHLPDVYSIKVYDARHNPPTQFSDWDDSDSEADEDYINEYENPTQVMYGFEGWWWASASKLGYLWFKQHYHDEELVTINCSWDGVKRFVHSDSAYRYGLDTTLHGQDRVGELQACDQASRAEPNA